MSGLQVKRTMEQIHIPKEMQEQILLNVQKKMENSKNNAGQKGTRPARRSVSWRKRTTVAAAALLATGIISVPVHALVQNFLAVRMEAIPEEEMKDIAYLVQTQTVEVDSFSRELSQAEKKRMKELWQLYQNGIFPEKTILMVGHAEEAADGVFCYIWENGLFILPDRALTEEELLEIIDFNEMRQYAITQSPAGQDVYKVYQAEQDRLAGLLAAAGGIDRETAVEMAGNHMQSCLGARAEGKIYPYVSLKDLSGADYEHTGDVAYFILFRDSRDNSAYACEIDSADGRVLNTEEYEPYGKRKGTPASGRERLSPNDTTIRIDNY